MLKLKLWCSGATLALAIANPNVALAHECKLGNGSQGVAPANQFDVGCFANGVRYILDVNPSLPPSIMLVVNAGTADELPGQGEAAHVIEHIGLSAYFADGRIYNRLVEQEKIRRINGFTTSKSTAYMIAPDVNFTESDYKPVVRALAEWLTDSAITPASVLRERSSVTAERAGSENVRILFAISSAVYGGRVGQLSERGGLDLPTLDVKALKAFHSKWYRPDLTAVIITGDIDIAHWKAALSSELGSLPLPRAPNPRPVPVPDKYIVPKPQQGRRYLTIPSANTEEMVVQLTSTRKSFNYGMQGSEHRQDLLREIVQYAVSERQLGFSGNLVAGVMNADDVDADGVTAKFSIKLDPEADLRSELTSKVSAAVIQLKSLRDYGLTEREIHKAKRYIESQFVREPWTVLQYYGSVAFRKSVSRLPSSSERRRLIESISPAEVNAVARQLVDLDRNFDIVLVAAGSTGDRDRAMSFVREGFDFGYRSPVPLPENRPFLKELVSGLFTPPEPLDVVRIDRDTEAFRLPGGQRVILHKLDRNLSDSGFAAAIEGRGPENGPALFSRSGMYYVTAPISYLPDDVDPRLAKDFLDSENIAYRLTVLPHATNLFIRSGRGRIDPLLQAIKVAVTAERPASVRNSESVNGILSVGSKRAAPLSAQSTMKDLLSRGDRAFAPRTIVISGDFDLIETRGLVMRYLGDLEPVKFDSVERPEMTKIQPLIRPTRSERAGSKGREVIYSFSAKYPDDRRSDAALSILTEVVGSSVFKEHRKAGSYSVSAFAPVIWRGDRLNDLSVGQLQLTYSAESDLVPKFDAITAHVIRQIASGQIEPKIFEAAKRKVAEDIQRENYFPELSSPALLEATARGESIANILFEREDAVSQVTLPEVQAMARLFLDQPMPKAD